MGLLTFLSMLVRRRLDEFSNSPVGVRGAEGALESGRILDIHTGRVIRTERDTSAWDDERGILPKRGDQLWRTDRVLLPDGDVLQVGSPQGPAEDSLSVLRFSPQGVERWRFESKDHAGGFSDRVFRFRLQGEYAYLMVEEEPGSIGRTRRSDRPTPLAVAKRHRGAPDRGRR